MITTVNLVNISQPHIVIGEGNGNPLLFLPGESHGWSSLVGYSPWGRKESDTTERLHFHFTLLYIFLL